MCLAALADAGITVDDLDAVVVGCGPGPFTGLRVGMATAAAYGQALGIPVHGVCSLDAIGVDTARARCSSSPTPAAARCTGRATATACASTGPRSTHRPTCRPTSARLPARPSTRRCSACRGSPVYPTASGLVRAVVDWAAAAAAAGAAVSAPSRRQAAGRATVAPMTVTYDALTPRRRRAVRGTGGAAVRRRRPVARGGVPAELERQAHPLRRRARRRQARRLRRHRAARAESRRTSTRFTPSASTPHTRARASAGGC